MRRLAEQAHPAFPVTIYYAFKQSEKKSDSGTASTGWETFLGAVIQAGFAISGTWPMRTELGNRMISAGTNALASSIVLVCRPRPADAADATRRELITALKRELPAALVYLQRGNIAPVDLAQAAIGPGMAVYTRFSRVLDAAGHALTVREALALINQALDEALAEQEGDFDADSRWALAWFEQHGFTAGDYGVAMIVRDVGWRTYGFETTHIDTVWQSLDRVRTFYRLLMSIMKASKWARDREANELLRVKQSVVDFMNELKGNDVIIGFDVEFDPKKNTKASVSAGKFYLTIRVGDMPSVRELNIELVHSDNWNNALINYLNQENKT